jgi:hypothetical protein
MNDQGNILRNPYLMYSKKHGMSSLSRNKSNYDKLPRIRIGGPNSSSSYEHNNSSDLYDSHSHLFVGEKLKFSPKYLKSNLNTGTKTRSIKNHVMSMLINNRSEASTINRSESYREHILKDIKSGSADESPERPNIRLFRNYLTNNGQTVNKYHIKLEHPYFIINSRQHGNLLSNPKLMNNIFNGNIGKLADRFNTKFN